MVSPNKVISPSHFVPRLGRVLDGMLEIGFEVTVAEPARVDDPAIESLLYNAFELRKPEMAMAPSQPDHT